MDLLRMLILAILFGMNIAPFNCVIICKFCNSHSRNSTKLNMFVSCKKYDISIDNLALVVTVACLMPKSAVVDCRQEYYCETDFKGNQKCGFKVVCD